MGKALDNDLTSYKTAPCGGLISLSNPTSNQLFLLFKEEDNQKWFDLMIESIDARIDGARKDGVRQIRHKIGMSTYICHNPKDLMDIQKKLIKLYKDTGYNVAIDTSATKLNNLPRAADIIIKISR